MKSSTKLVLLAIGSIFGSITGGYLAAVADISLSLTGFDITGISGIEYLEPDKISMIDKVLPLAIHLTLGIGLLAFAIITLLKAKRGGNIFHEGEKFEIFSLISGFSVAGAAFFATMIAPRMSEDQRSTMMALAVFLSGMLISKTIRLLKVKKPG